MAVLIAVAVVMMLVGAVLFGLWQGRKTKGPEAGRDRSHNPRG